jgi:hypothetical protein
MVGKRCEGGRASSLSPVVLRFFGGNARYGILGSAILDNLAEE